MLSRKLSSVLLYVKSSMYNYSNYTQFGIKSSTERYLWVGWMLFVVIVSLIGDSIILIASIKYNAFKLHKIIVVLIQHIAANDLLYSLASITPAMLSAFYNIGSPYRFLDFVRFFFNYYTAAISSVFVCVMTLGKVLLVKYPFRVGFMSARKAHKI